MTTGLSRIDDLLAKMRGVFEADAPPAVAAPDETPPEEPEKKEPEKDDDEGKEKTENKLSADAQDWISKKISKLDKEGYPQKQAIAIAYSMARKAGYDVPAAPKEEDEPEKKEPETPAMQPRKDEPKDEYMEAFGVPKAALRAAKDELATYSDFLAKYRDGDINAFESVVAENDFELAARCKTRPPQMWFEEAVRLISQDESVNDPAELAAWLWTHWVPKNARAKIAGK